MGPVLATALAPLVIAIAIAGGVRAHRRAGFAATVRRAHPELATVAAEVPGCGLGRVAGRAVNVRTPPAPRALAAALEVV